MLFDLCRGLGSFGFCLAAPADAGADSVPASSTNETEAPKRRSKEFFFKRSLDFGIAPG
jgi:hypothetical protein